MRKLVRGGVVAFIGYMLSPLSWWNDLFINIPIAYGFAVLVSLISCRLFTPAMITGYWLTNIVGLILMHRGVADIAARPGSGIRGPESGPRPPIPDTRHPISDVSLLGFRAVSRRPPAVSSLLINLAIGTGYTGLIALLAVLGVLKPPKVLQRECPAVPIHFAREEIAMKVVPGAVVIAGNYHFTNPFKRPTATRIFYPFPLDSLDGYPDSIALPGRTFEPGDSGVYFNMTFTPGHEDSFFAWYRQPVKGKSARYIVTTTRRWGRAIDLARFRIEVPANLPGAELSYRPDRIERTDSTVVYTFSRKSFYPDKDVIVTWR